MAERTYETDEIVIYWDSSRCIHTGNCLRALPEVFDTSQRPWVQPGGHLGEEIAQAIERCPTGALKYEWKDGRAVADKGMVRVVPAPNGPLFVRGMVSVEMRDGTVVAQEDRVALCRCGASQNQPFCDLSHKSVGFRDNPNVIPEYRREADAPDEVESATE